MRITSKSLLYCMFLLAVPAVVEAHELHGGGGFVSGMSHPVLGFDHLLAMVSVGILSTQIGGRAIWSVPLTFVLVMFAGGVVGIAGISLPFVEHGIAFSVIVLGGAITTGKKFPTLPAMYVVALFAVFHGHAHGTEMPSLARPVFYTLGFALGTAANHVAGVLIGIVAMRSKTIGVRSLRLAGAGITATGLFFLLGA